jgi:ubiquitin carboxyl-terminal hydrolase 4/11/15
VNSRLDFLNCGETDIILVEYAEDEKDFFFKIKKIDYQEGICPGCDDRMVKMLINPCSCKEIWYCSEQCKDLCFADHQNKCKNFGLDEDDFRKTDKSKMGLTGLQNLGNTCFMNTSIQCISNCWELTNYFLKNHYKTDINEKNPIGTKGILARAYANMLKNIWYGEKSVYSPWNFKRAIANFQPMVSNYF